ncbi:secreted RxLR effector peptide protein, putative [Phytophthora infestans T30-4]|uniref:RxLR effector protein n=1 Tax=Phytophthora infestans (strain T30-4) TaxID=403677 RepID=D0P4D7_PHYIT|nr:secreted RxLR effector peptide protein, putative [Phytophthora infestans T30-4]EEY65101.1 secreted RxLR effector peptide protein, putative [Phytophthora infestans T30-4]|eukprot:XP_002894836.1 secreted RxLR effector peptide protein, putative [Phytophthora infestans T30-4]
MRLSSTGLLAITALVASSGIASMSTIANMAVPDKLYNLSSTISTRSLRDSEPKGGRNEDRMNAGIEKLWGLIKAGTSKIKEYGQFGTLEWFSRKLRTCDARFFL